MHATKQSRQGSEDAMMDARPGFEDAAAFVLLRLLRGPPLLLPVFAAFAVVLAAVAPSAAAPAAASLNDELVPVRVVPVT